MTPTLRCLHRGKKDFEFQFQERSDVKRVVCFSPQKIADSDILHKQTTKSLVRLLRISPQKRKFQLNCEEYIVNSSSKVSVTTNFSFPWQTSSKGFHVNVEDG